MSEGRRSQVVLLDERRLDILIQPRLYAGELLEMVASHFQIKEKEFFGLAFVNDANQLSWLQLDQRILEQELPKKALSQDAVLTLHFRVKYFVESIEHLRDASTVEAYYLQVKSLLAKGEIEADSDTVFKLAALVLQATYGDFDDELTFKIHLRRLLVLPSSVLKEYPSINLCEEKILQHYKDQIGQSRGDAILNYLKIIETLPTYGQHYYEIKDIKTGLPYWLGLSYKGISQYEKNNRRYPIRVFLWKQLENLYKRDKKFTIEVHEARRVVHTLSSFNLYEDAIEEPVEDYDDLSNAICDPTTQVSVSRRTLAPANVTVYVWFASSPLTTKCIWSMAISQHLFFLNRKKNQSSESNLTQIASELCRSVHSLSSGESVCNISRSNSSSSLPSTILGGEISEESKAAALEMLEALRTRKEALEAVLTKKTEELKALCLQEGELTGEIPPEIPLKPGESQPQVRRRVGTSFSLSDKFIPKIRNNDRETLNDLELQYEIQSKIASAAFQLMNNCNSRKSVRKQRKISYDQATLKLRTIERKLCTLKREKKKKEELESQNQGTDEVDKIPNKTEPSDDNEVNPIGDTTESSQASTESNLLKIASPQAPSSVPSTSLPELTVTECPLSSSQDDIRQCHQSLQQLPYTNTSTFNEQLDKSRTFSVFRNAQSSSSSSSCQQNEYDSISCGSANSLRLRTAYRNRYEPRLDIDSTNLYSVPNRRASQIFDSQDDMLLSAKKCDYECRSTMVKDQDIKPVYSNAVPLSASYDDRIWYGESKDNTLISSDGSSLETSFEAHSNNSCETASLSCFSSESHKQSSCGSPKNLPKQMHFHSENALNHNVSSPVIFSIPNIDNSVSNFTQPIPQKKITHVHSVPHLYVEPVQKLEQPQRINSSTSSTSQHNISQTIDLVHASILLQNGKKTVASSSKYSSSRPKTKEWIETSLDSPMLPRKQRFKEPSLPVNNFGDDQGSVKSNVIPKFSSTQKRVICAEPDRKCFESIEVESHSSSCFNIPATVANDQCNSAYYRLSHPSEPFINDDSVSLQSCSYSFRDPKNVSPTPFQRNVHNENATRRFSSVSDISSFYGDYCDSNVCFEKSGNHFYPPSHTFHSTSPAEQSTTPYTSTSLQTLPSVQSHHIISSASDTATDSGVYSAHYTNASECLFPNNPQIPNQQFDFMAGSDNFYKAPCNPFPTPLVTSTQQYQDAEIYVPPSATIETTLKVNTAQEIHVPVSPCSPVNMTFPSNVEVNVVSVGHFQPYWEETKPYELSDFYKYSTKHRKHTPKQKDHPKNVVSAISPLQQNSNEPWMNQHSANLPVLPDELSNVQCPPCSNFISEHNQELLIAEQSTTIKPPSYKTLKSNCVPEKCIKKPPTQDIPSNDDSLSNTCTSLADTFHDEMLAWYEKQETVKKATLV